MHQVRLSCVVREGAGLSRVDIWEGGSVRSGKGKERVRGKATRKREACGEAGKMEGTRGRYLARGQGTFREGQSVRGKTRGKGNGSVEVRGISVLQ